MDHYVYQFIDPLSEQPFYIGKGSKKRMYRKLSTIKNEKNQHLFNKIQKLRAEGNLEIRKKVKEFKNEADALKYESLLIEKIGLDNLCNLTPGGTSPPIHCGPANVNFKDLTNSKYGRLRVEKYMGNSQWLCRCDCGKEKTAKTAYLTSGDTKSCGCLRSNGPNQMKGSAHVFSKLTMEEAKQIRSLYTTSSVTQRELAAKYMVHAGTIQAIIDNRTWKE